MSLKGRRKRQHRAPGSHVDKYAGLAEKARQASAASQVRWERKAAEAETTPIQTGDVEPVESVTE